jgi:hypothetical protein
MVENDMTAGRGTYAGLFLVALATLMYEILLTRIFSVTMWYHFAFVAISIALFGMTLGAVLVYLFPARFSLQDKPGRLGVWSLLFGLAIVISFIVHLSIHVVPDTTSSGLTSLAATYAIIAVPFMFSGICVCVCLTQFPRQVSRLYAADLCGAAVGCLLLIAVLEMVDGPTAVLLVAAMALVGAFGFAADGTVRSAKQGGATRVVSILATLGLVGLATFNTHLAATGRQPIKLTWVKGGKESPAVFEKWNSFSRVRVEDDGGKPRVPMGWGLSDQYPADRVVRQLYLGIDATAGTYLTQFDGTAAGSNSLDFLRYDVTNLAYYLRPHANALVIGVGGGRDVLSAMQFDPKSITGVEINRSILHALTDRFGDFTGHLDRDPRVTLVNDEARSFVARSRDHFDTIQISLIDTWAATAAGAFVLSENSLYTLQAWDAFLSHLTPNGVLTVSRWYHRARPGETYRLTALAGKALRNAGVADPRRNIIVVRRLPKTPKVLPGGVGTAAPGAGPDGIATLLASPQAFSDQDVATIEHVSRQMGFDVILSPTTADDPELAELASTPNVDELAAKFPLDISPPTDNKPFFFNMARLRDSLNPAAWRAAGTDVNLKAVSVLGGLLIFVVVLTAITIVVPIVARSGLKTFTGSALPLTIYFCCIGVGFMLIEISQMQRLIVLLGHPTYSLSVVLFALLVSSGLGSATTRDLPSGQTFRRLVLLVIVLSIVSLCTPFLTPMFQAQSTPVRILAALAVLLPAGFFMGMAFPVGMKRAAQENAALTPWLWGVNGATSVCASVLAVVIAMAWGINAASWIGVGCYVIAAAAFARSTRIGRVHQRFQPSVSALG